MFPTISYDLLLFFPRKKSLKKNPTLRNLLLSSRMPSSNRSVPTNSNQPRNRRSTISPSCRSRLFWVEINQLELDILQVWLTFSCLKMKFAYPKSLLKCRKAFFCWEIIAWEMLSHSFGPQNNTFPLVFLVPKKCQSNPEALWHTRRPGGNEVLLHILRLLKGYPM